MSVVYWVRIYCDRCRRRPCTVVGALAWHHGKSETMTRKNRKINKNSCMKRNRSMKIDIERKKITEISVTKREHQVGTQAKNKDD